MKVEEFGKVKAEEPDYEKSHWASDVVGTSWGRRGQVLGPDKIYVAFGRRDDVCRRLFKTGPGEVQIDLVRTRFDLPTASENYV